MPGEEGKSEEMIQMEEDAREEWEKRGLDEDEFDLERMIEIWEEEDQEEDKKPKEDSTWERTTNKKK